MADNYAHLHSSTCHGLDHSDEHAEFSQAIVPSSRHTRKRSSMFQQGFPKTAITFICSLFLMAISGTHAQEAGEICACSPSTYEFTFDFSLACPRPGGNYGPGVAEVTCFITSFSADVSDLVPVSVQTISIIEADINRVPIAQSAIEGDYASGSTFTYSSVSALGDGESPLPQSIQLTITGTNAANSSLVQVWAIKFTNDCTVFPVLNAGESFGWTEFTTLGDPRYEVCPAAPRQNPEELPAITEDPETQPEATEEPEATPEVTAATTSEPTFSPTKSPKKTSAPTVADTEAPTMPPTIAPTLVPTVAPQPEEPESVVLPGSTTVTTKPPKGGGKGDKGDKDDDTESPVSVPTVAPSVLDLIGDDETDAPSSMVDMSFSYLYNDGDFDIDSEWGREDEKGDKKDKKTRKDDDKKGRDRKVRVGKRRTYY